MNPADMMAVKKQIESDPHLFSARYNKDYETMASVVNATRAKDAQLSALDIHICCDTRTDQDK